MKNPKVAIKRPRIKSIQRRTQSSLEEHNFFINLIKIFPCSLSITLDHSKRFEPNPFSSPISKVSNAISADQEPEGGCLGSK